MALFLEYEALAYVSRDELFHRGSVNSTPFWEEYKLLFRKSPTGSSKVGA